MACATYFRKIGAVGDSRLSSEPHGSVYLKSPISVASLISIPRS
jgi:hypothetical protein